MISVGKKIKTLREQKGFSQEQVADYLNISQPTYARIESGERNSWANYIEPLCTFFEIKPEDLLKQDSFVFNQKNKEGDNNGVVINHLTEELKTQYKENKKLYEENAKLKDQIIEDLRKCLAKYE